MSDLSPEARRYANKIRNKSALRCPVCNAIDSLFSLGKKFVRCRVCGVTLGLVAIPEHQIKDIK